MTDSLDPVVRHMELVCELALNHERLVAQGKEAISDNTDACMSAFDAVEASARGLAAKPVAICGNCNFPDGCVAHGSCRLEYDSAQAAALANPVVGIQEGTPDRPDIEGAAFGRAARVLIDSGERLHEDTLRSIVRAALSPDRPDPVRAALAELVALEDLLERIALYNPLIGEIKVDALSGKTTHALDIEGDTARRADYNRRKPIAWANARALLTAGKDTL